MSAVPVQTNESLGGLVVQAAEQTSELVRKEVQLAKAELAEEIGKAARGAGMFGGAGVTAWLAVVFLSLAVMFGLGESLPMWAAALIVGGGYALLAGALLAGGRATLGQVSAVPERTVQSLKEDVEWARHLVR